MNNSPSKNQRVYTETACYAVYLLLISPVFYGIVEMSTVNRPLFHLLLFATGFLTFTFMEYIAHRFWMHGKEIKHPGKSLERHLDHHRHPTELKITPRLRNTLLSINVLLGLIAVCSNNYITVFTGLYSGFVYYCFMHFFLHQPWARKVLPGLQASHIHHHCKFPDRCFSTCTTWWDRLFNTSVPREVKIPPRIIAFYFGKSGQ